jgi:hypothetical protein
VGVFAGRKNCRFVVTVRPRVGGKGKCARVKRGNRYLRTSRVGLSACRCPCFALAYAVIVAAAGQVGSRGVASVTRIRRPHFIGAVNLGRGPPRQEIRRL